MTDIKFYKGVGLGNDFIIIDARLRWLEFPPEDIERLCDRRYGIGGDQVLVIGRPSDSNATARIEFYNQDGSKAGACGNGTRCVALLLMEDLGREKVMLETRDRILIAKNDPEQGIMVEMGQVTFPLSFQMRPEELGVKLEPESVRGVYIGNNHLVMLFETIGGIDFPRYGQILDKHPKFPERCNVNFAHVLNSREIALVVWEHGAGMTPACGTGAVATAAAARQLRLVGDEVEVQQRGGTLVIGFDEDWNATMAGPAEIVYSGTISVEG